MGTIENHRVHQVVSGWTLNRDARAWGLNSACCLALHGLSNSPRVPVTTGSDKGMDMGCVSDTHTKIGELNPLSLTV